MIYKLHSKIHLKSDIKTVWEFFSNPYNLKLITPPALDFTVTSNPPEKIYEGMIISYKVSPFPKIKTNWLSEITYIREGEYFVDEQRYGQYKIWHHQHIFRSLDNGLVEVEDIVDYVMPFSFLGSFVHFLFVKKQLESIFNYRSKALEQYFIVINS